MSEPQVPVLPSCGASPSRRTLALAAGAAVAAGLTGVAAPASAAGAPVAGASGAGAAGRRGRCPDITEGGLLEPTSDLTRAQVEALDRVDYLVGTWDGTGWSQLQDGRIEYRQVEQVDRYLAGQLLTVQGRSTRRSRPYDVMFRAFATLGYDPATSTYLWTPHTAEMAAPAPMPFEVTEDGWAWEVPLGGSAKYRYEAHFSGRGLRQWDQTGWFTDGDNQVEIFGMHVRRCSR